MKGLALAAGVVMALLLLFAIIGGMSGFLGNVRQ